MKVAVTYRSIIERDFVVEVPTDDWDEAQGIAEAAVYERSNEDAEFWRLIPGQHIDDQSPWQFSELDYGDINPEAYDEALPEIEPDIVIGLTGEVNVLT